MKKCEDISRQNIVLQNKSSQYFQRWSTQKRNGSLKEIEKDTSKNSKKLVKFIA